MLHTTKRTFINEYLIHRNKIECHFRYYSDRFLDERLMFLDLYKDVDLAFIKYYNNYVKLFFKN